MELLARSARWPIVTRRESAVISMQPKSRFGRNAPLTRSTIVDGVKDITAVCQTTGQRSRFARRPPPL